MSLILTGSRDHALLAMVVQEARKQSDRRGGPVGRGALVRIMYFLKSLGVPTLYRFEIYHYGPVCDEILQDVDWLLADEVIRDTSRSPGQYASYAPAEAMDELLAGHGDDIEAYGGYVTRIVHALAPLTSERLELIATLDYQYRWKRASGGSGPWKPLVVSRFHEIKRDKFPQEEVARTYDMLAEVGLFEP